MNKKTKNIYKWRERERESEDVKIILIELKIYQWLDLIKKLSLNQHCKSFYIRMSNKWINGHELLPVKK